MGISGKATCMLIFLFQSLVSIAQNDLFEVQKLNVGDGLPHRSSYDIVQDHSGFIWISTPGSINRYDGYQVKNHDFQTLNIDENTFTHLAIDKNNRLWYCERKLLDQKAKSGILDIDKDSLFSIKQFSKGLFDDNDIVYVGQSNISKNSILLATKQGSIYTYNGTFKKVFDFKKPFVKPVVSEFIDDGQLLILSGNALSIVKKGSSIIETYYLKDEEETFLRIISASPRIILESHNGKGKRYWQISEEKLIPYSFSTRDDNKDFLFYTGEHYDYYCNNNHIIIQNKDGIIVFEYTIEENIKISTDFNKVFLDRQNILWASSQNGVYKIIRKKNYFETTQEGNSIRGIYSEGQTLFIGGYTRNLMLDIKSKAVSNFPEENGAFSSFQRDNKGNLWIGTTANRIYKYDAQKQQWNNFKLVNSENLYLTYQNPSTEKIWIGSGNGLYYIENKNNTVKPFRLPAGGSFTSNTEIRQFYQNKEGLWIVTNTGLFLMDGSTEKIKKHFTKKDGLPEDNLNFLYEDREGIYWLASKLGGLIRWDPDNNSFRQFTNKEGLSNNTLYAVYEDDYNTIWLPSNYGLMRFDKTDHTVQVFLPENGIAHEEFNTFAHHKAADGTLYFGGINGITTFHPKNIGLNKGTNYPVYLTRLQVFDRKANSFVDKTHELNTSNNVYLNYNDRMLEIEVTLLDFEYKGNHQFAYKIEGIDSDWFYTNKNKISLIGLTMGNHLIKIKGKGSSGDWTNEVLEIPVFVDAPFYLKWQFILSACAIITSLTALAIRWRIKSLKSERTRLEEEVQNRTREIEKDKQIIASQAEELKQLDLANTNFFSNITHEFRTPLTLIIGPLEQLIVSQPAPTIFKRRIQGVLKNARHILVLINQLLDISKIESGQMKVEIVKGDVIDYTRELINRFQSLSKNKGQKLYFLADKKSWFINFDNKKWDKIIYNLLSNAIKFTPEGKEIQVSLEEMHHNNEPHLKLSVKDAGIGIPEDQLEHIFDRFYQVDHSATREQQGTGIGLSLVKELIHLQKGTIEVFSEVGKGTTFEVLLPIPKTVGAEPPITPLTVTDSILFENKIDLPAQQLSLNSPAEKNLEVLIVEDNEEMREYIRHCLSDANYKITEASNGEEGLEKAMALIPDLIISDVMMPQKDGFELTEALRKNTGTSHIPLILLTAKIALESKIKGLKSGADLYLTKPFSPEELSIQVEKIINLRTILQQRYQNNALAENKDAFQQEDAFILKLRSFILKNIHDPDLNGDKIGGHFALSRVHLYRKLKALTNLSISEYVKNIRLEKAKELLKENKFNVSEVADMTGFSSVSLFSRSFKQAFGQSPTKM